MKAIIDFTSVSDGQPQRESYYFVLRLWGDALYLDTLYWDADKTHWEEKPTHSSGIAGNVMYWAEIKNFGTVTQ